MERLTERMVEADRALVSLTELLALPRHSVVERDAAILRFAYTFEAMWKTAQRHLAEREGVEKLREYLVVIYKDGAPEQVIFTGYSSD